MFMRELLKKEIIDNALRYEGRSFFFNLDFNELFSCFWAELRKLTGQCRKSDEKG